MAGELAGLRVGILHGQLRAAERDETMDARSGPATLDVLVATTVIEVGVDVPEATVMVIEDADRFGIAQLHQLRGRVGRGSARSWCYLLSEQRHARGRDPPVRSRAHHRRLRARRRGPRAAGRGDHPRCPAEGPNRPQAGPPHHRPRPGEPRPSRGRGGGRPRTPRSTPTRCSTTTSRSSSTRRSSSSCSRAEAPTATDQAGSMPWRRMRSSSVERSGGIGDDQSRSRSAK